MSSFWKVSPQSSYISKNEQESINGWISHTLLQSFFSFKSCLMNPKGVFKGLDEMYGKNDSSQPPSAC